MLLRGALLGHFITTYYRLKKIQIFEQLQILVLSDVGSFVKAGRWIAAVLCLVNSLDKRLLFFNLFFDSWVHSRIHTCLRTEIVQVVNAILLAVSIFCGHWSDYLVLVPELEDLTGVLGLNWELAGLN